MKYRTINLIKELEEEINVLNESFMASNEEGIVLKNESEIEELKLMLKEYKMLSRKEQLSVLPFTKELIMKTFKDIVDQLPDLEKTDKINQLAENFSKIH